MEIIPKLGTGCEMREAQDDIQTRVRRRSYAA